MAARLDRLSGPELRTAAEGARSAAVGRAVRSELVEVLRVGLLRQLPPREVNEGRADMIRSRPSSAEHDEAQPVSSKAQRLA